MNASLIAKEAYATPNMALRSERSVEYDVLARITHQLRAAKDKQDHDYAGFVKALDTNREFWSLQAINVADERNELPQELRAGLFYLAEFVMAQTRKVLRSAAPVDSLIDVNLTIMRGLQPQGEAA